MVLAHYLAKPGLIACRNTLPWCSTLVPINAMVLRAKALDKVIIVTGIFTNGS
jgi:hypothetical protein